MGILATIDRQIQAATYADREGWLADWLRGKDETDGAGPHVSVNPRNAMTLAVVWQCVGWRAKMYGHLPHKVLENVVSDGMDSQAEARSHWLWPVIHSAPNPTLTSAAYFGLISADLHLDGNSYAWKERGSNTGRIRRLWRFCPDAIRIEQSALLEIDYFARRSDGTEEHFSSDEILHIRGLGYDGVRGYNPIRMMREELGWTMKTRNFSSKFYDNAFRPSGLLTSPATLKPEVKKALLEALRESGKEGGLALIEGALDYKPLTIQQDDAQFLETMQFQDERVAGIMEVYPQEIGIMRQMTNNNVEQMTISSVTRNLVPFAVGVEQWMNLQLFSDAPSSGRGGGTERERYFINSNFNALMRGDTASQTAHLIAMRDRGIYDGNQCARYLGNAPFEGGDVRVINAAYVPLDMLKEIAQKRGSSPAPGAPNPDGGPAQDPATASSLARLFSHVFRDAVGRTIKRKDREKAATANLAPVLRSISDAIESGADDAFIGDYLSALGQRSQSWDESMADEISETELKRAVEALIGRQS